MSCLRWSLKYTISLVLFEPNVDLDFTEGYVEFCLVDNTEAHSTYYWLYFFQFTIIYFTFNISYNTSQHYIFLEGITNSSSIAHCHDV